MKKNNIFKRLGYIGLVHTLFKQSNIMGKNFIENFKFGD